MNLSEAGIGVTIQEEIDNEIHAGDWFQLSDYRDMGEFYEACCSYFPEEDNPVFMYPAWENIPGILINEKWFCPDFFEIRDALEQLDESETDYFLEWCDHHGHNIAADDPYLLVANYLDIHTSYMEFENDTTGIPDDTYLYQNVTNSHFDTERYAMEIFDDNYN
jgi:hypothetical protein